MSLLSFNKRIDENVRNNRTQWLTFPFQFEVHSTCMNYVVYTCHNFRKYASVKVPDYQGRNGKLKMAPLEVEQMSKQNEELAKWIGSS